MSRRMSTLNDPVVEFLRKRAFERGYSRKGRVDYELLGEEMGRHPNTVYNYFEQEDRSPRVDVFIDLCAALGIDLVKLIISEVSPRVIDGVDLRESTFEAIRRYPDQFRADVLDYVLDRISWAFLDPVTALAKLQRLKPPPDPATLAAMRNRQMWYAFNPTGKEIAQILQKMRGKKKKAEDWFYKLLEIRQKPQRK